MRIMYITISLFTFSWPRFESGSLRNGGMLAIRIFSGSMMSRKYCATSELLHVPAVLAMLGRGSRSAQKRKSYITRTILFARVFYLFFDIREILIIHNLVFHAITPIAYFLFARNSQNTTPNIHTVYVKKMV